WHFLESPLRRQWSGFARGLGQQEVWALNLPRLSLETPIDPVAEETEADPSLAAPAPGWPGASLSLRLAMVAGGRAEIRLEGRMGSRGAQRLRAVVESLARDGCRRLALDIRALEAVTPEAMAALLTAARRINALGGEVRIVEHGRRFRRSIRAV